MPNNKSICKFLQADDDPQGTENYNEIQYKSMHLISLAQTDTRLKQWGIQ